MEATSVERWGVSEVCEWLASIGLGALQDTFEREQIDGCALLTLSEDDAKVLGVTALGHRRKFQAAITGLRQQQQQSPFPTVVVASAPTIAPKQQPKAAATATAACCAGVAGRISDEVETAAAAAATTTPAHLGDLTQFIPPEYSAPPLPQALQDAGIPNAAEVSGLCMDVARRAEASGALQSASELPAERAAFVAAYTFDFGPGERSDRNPFRVLNTALFERNALKLGRVRGLLFGLLSALRSLPRFSAPGNVLYRGIRARVNMDSAHYRAGSTVTWHSFTSTTTDLAVTKAFLTDAATGKCEGTLFIVKGAWGYDVQPLSFFNTEREILLEPEIDFVVLSVLDGPMIVVELEMVPRPLLLEKLVPPKTLQPVASDVELKGLEGIRNNIAALRTHAANADVCARACAALRSIAVNEESRMMIAHEGGIPLIIAALRTHAANADVCARACAALMSIAVNEESRMMIAHEGGIPLIIAALRTHAANADVCAQACSALKNIAINDDNQVHIFREGGIFHVISALKMHSANKEVCTRALNALNNLSLHATNKEAIKEAIRSDPALKQFRRSLFPKFWQR